MPLNYMAKMVNFILYIFYHDKKCLEILTNLNKLFGRM